LSRRRAVQMATYSYNTLRWKIGCTQCSVSAGMRAGHERRIRRRQRHASEVSGDRPPACVHWRDAGPITSSLVRAPLCAPCECPAAPDATTRGAVQGPPLPQRAWRPSGRPRPGAAPAARRKKATMASAHHARIAPPEAPATQFQSVRPRFSGRHLGWGGKARVSPFE